MPGSCSKPDCHPDLSCVLGEVDRTECEHWKPEGGADTAEAHDVQTEAPGVPWSGVSAGTTDLAYLAARGRPRIVGLIGPHDAGKTTCLAVFYSTLLGRGRIGTRLFAGSHTLAGWEGIARHMRWAAGRPATFPPHTSSYATREPGLLHVAIRTGEHLEDVLFTDAPGEWFTEWARAENSSAADGARWIARQADVLLLVVDSQALADTKTRGQARSHYQSIVERVSSVAEDRPVFFLRTKSDVALPDTVMEFLRMRQHDYFPRSAWQHVTKNAPDELFASMVTAIEHTGRHHSVLKGALFPVTEPTDPFLSFRGAHG